MFIFLLAACAANHEAEPGADTPREGRWEYCWEDDLDPEGSRGCNELDDLFTVIDARSIGFGGSPCAFDWPAVICWESRTTADPSEYRDTDYAYPDQTVALLGYFLDEKTFKGRQVEATTWTPLDDRWAGGSLTRSTITATWVSED